MSIDFNLDFTDSITNESTDQPAIIYVHGCPGDWEDLDADFRSSKDIRFIGIRRPGFASSPLSKKALSFDGQAQLIINFMDSKKIESAILMGHSLGAAIALWTAGKFPTRISGLVAVAPYYRDDSGTQISSLPKVLRLPLIGSLAAWIIARSAGKKALQQNIQKSFGSERIDSALVEKMTLQYSRAATLIAMIEEKNALLAVTPQFEATVSQLQIPLVILSSDNDQVASKQAAELSEKTARASWIHSKRGGHLASQFSERDLSQAVDLILSKQEKKNVRASGL